MRVTVHGHRDRPDAVHVRLGVVALVVALTWVVAGCGGRTVPDVDVRAAAGDARPPGPDDVLVDGGWPEVAAFVTDAAAAGEPTVVNLFGSWCAPCAEELPLLLEESATTPGVRWLGVAVQDVARNAVPFVEELDVTWPSVLDLEGSTHTALDGIVMPTTAFFDAEGRLVSVVDGILDEDRLARELARIQP